MSNDSEESIVCNPDEDTCEWVYDGGDPSVGLNPGWECKTCGKVDTDRSPPSDEDWDY